MFPFLETKLVFVFNKSLGNYFTSSTCCTQYHTNVHRFNVIFQLWLVDPLILRAGGKILVWPYILHGDTQEYHSVNLILSF